MPHCIDGDTVKKVKVLKFDGCNFNEAAKKHGEAFKKMTRKQSGVNLKAGVRG
jgi:hypothetical protein